MSLKYIDGDLIQLAKEGKFEVIVHGCNCFNVMEAGIASQIAKAFPKAYEADSFYYYTEFPENWDMLGNLSHANYKKNYFHPALKIINAYTQYEPGANFDMNAFILCIKKIEKHIEHTFDKNPKTVKIGFPKIGSGIGGGDWEEISQVMEVLLKGYDVTIVNYKK